MTLATQFIVTAIQRTQNVLAATIAITTATVAPWSVWPAVAQDELPGARPVPGMQVVPLPYAQASLERDGQEIARYHFGAMNHRPFLFPIVGPSGRSLTRMGHPQDPNGHSHHNSVWISHNDINGVIFWGDQGKGRIVHQRLDRYDDGPESAGLVALNHWTDDKGQVLLNERRWIQVQRLANKEFLLVIDLEIDAEKSPAVIGKTPFGFIGVRMAKTIGVHDGGGRIRNSQGGVNEEGVFWKSARWCDYSGPITPQAIEGITLLDHPGNPNHPTVFHVRDDGWMGACLTFDGPRTLEPGQPLRLRYGLYVHGGMPSPQQLEQRWKEFAATEPPKTLAPQKKE